MSDNLDWGSKAVSALDEKLELASFDYEKSVSEAIQNCPSNLDTYDYIFSVTFGVLGAVITTNEQISSFLNRVHELANSDATSGTSIADFLAKLLHHKGDWIDQVPTDAVTKTGKPVTKFVTRGAKRVADAVWDHSNAGPKGPHRIFWGHDVFSFQEDNPLFLSINQYGVCKGVLQAIRHLIADTCSHQGLPLPGSSWFDYKFIDANGNAYVAGNYLLDFCNKYGKEIKDATGHNPNSTFNNEVFNHLFSLHMQDVVASGLASAGIAAYCKARDVDNEDRKLQMLIIAHGFNFCGSAIMGAAQYGIPYVNWPCFSALSKNIIKLVRTNYIEIAALSSESERIVLEGAIIGQQEAEARKQLLCGLLGDLTTESADAGRNELINFLGKDD